MDYAIAIATRNRLEALRVSVPLFLGQTRPPARVVVADFSDDHDPVRDLCLAAGRAAGVPVTVLRADRGNLPHQRNLALTAVGDAAVVAMPDDDSFWFPDTAERLMAVYAADRAGRIGGVTGIEVQVSPADPAAGAAVRSTRLVQTPAVARLRNRLEAALVPQPFNLYGEARTAELAPAAGHPGPFVPTMGGYRMSFRTAAIRAVGFDATLGSRVGYAQHEDKDACMRLLRAGWLLAAAPGARVFHNTHPGRRARGFAYGFFQIFNYAYICAGAFAADGPPAERRARHALLPYLRYKAFLYGLRRGDGYHRAVHAGARAALAEVPALLAAAPAELPARYAALSGRHLAAIAA